MTQSDDRARNKAESAGPDTKGDAPQIEPATGTLVGWRTVMHMKVMKEQFVLDGDKLTHTPTGATFWLGDKDVVACERGRLNLDTGDDYDLDELKEEAWRIMAAERNPRSGITDSQV